MTTPLPSLDDLFAEAPCGLLVTALDGTLLKINATFCGWIGYTCEELIGQRKLQDFFTVGAKIFHQTHWVPMLQMQGSLSEVKFDVRKQSGETVPMIFNARRRHRPEGAFDEIAAFVALDRNRYERELMAARQRADQLLSLELQSKRLLQDRALFAEQMVGIVSHDLRNPLAAILAGVQLLERVDNDRRPRVLGQVRSSVDRARRLVDELLDFTQARVGSGLSIHLRTIDLHAVAAAAVEELRLAFPDRTIEHTASGPGACLADPDRVAQLIGNLVGNAVTYGYATTAIVVTSASSHDTTRLSVRNEGVPIAPARWDSIFEPMVRGEVDTTTRSVGLGLYIVNEIAKAHAGTMHVASSAEAGTEFTFAFPTTGQPAADVATQA